MSMRYEPSSEPLQISVSIEMLSVRMGEPALADPRQLDPRPPPQPGILLLLLSITLEPSVDTNVLSLIQKLIHKSMSLQYEPCSERCTLLLSSCTRQAMASLLSPILDSSTRAPLRSPVFIRAHLLFLEKNSRELYYTTGAFVEEISLPEF